jgi:hypothetical protein
LLIVVPNFGGWWTLIMGPEWQWLKSMITGFTAAAQNFDNQSKVFLDTFTLRPWSSGSPEIWWRVLLRESSEKYCASGLIEDFEIREPGATY